MQDRYVGDVGDFGKYGLLRSLCSADDHTIALRLGVLWYRFDGEDTAAAHNGGHTEYLASKPSRHERHLKSCDPDLFDRMLDIVNNDRTIAAVESHGVLPPDTEFFGTGQDFRRIPLQERCAKRRNWLETGLRKVVQAELVFLDPDNGLEVPSCGRHSLKGPKYVYYDDLQPCWERGQSLVVYHHIGRTYRGRRAEAGEQIRGRCQDLAWTLPGVEPIAVRYRRRSPRVYFILPRPEHAILLRTRTEAFLASPWGYGNPPHFELVGATQR